MTELLMFREQIRNIYQKYQNYVKPITKFLMAIVVFLIINTTIGYNEKLTGIPILLLLSLICAVTPTSIVLLLAMVVASAHIYVASRLLAVVFLAIMCVLYFLFIHYTPGLGIVVLAVPVLTILKIPYVVPLLLGLMGTPISIIPVSCGVIVYYFFRIIKEIASSINLGVEDSFQLYITAVDTMLSNKQMLVTIVVFALIIFVTYLVRRLPINYANEIGLLAGTITCLLLFLIGDLMLDVSEQIIAMVFGTILSAGIVFVIQFFHILLDYSTVETVQFEDDDYYYYVKAVPKVHITSPEKNVKRINRHSGRKRFNNGSKERYEEKFEDTDDFSNLKL